MATIKGSTGTVEVDDVKNMASGTRNFISEIRPRALIPTNAKELILKDADYSTPQDHYFGYVHRNKDRLKDEGVSMS